MRLSTLSRLFCATALCSVGAALPGLADSAGGRTGRDLNSFGMPGAIETPTAEALPDATLAGGISYSGLARRTFLTSQITPWLTGSLRYSRIDGIDRDRGYLMDRSFDIHVRLLEEQGWRPAVAAGLRDFMGTGVYSGEYLVASKTLTPSIRASLGLGWGRLGGTVREVDIGEGGTPHLDEWFTGDVRPFGSITWQATEALSLTAEYGNDRYAREAQEGTETPKGRVNLGLHYQGRQGYQLSAYNLGGNVWGAQISFAVNPRTAVYPSGLEPAGAPVRPRPAPGADPDGWSGAWTADPTAHPVIQKTLAEALAKDGQQLQSMSLTRDRAEIRIRNTRYIQQAEAVGRSARLLTRALPASVETMVITSVQDGLPASSVVLRRADVERLENTEAGRIAAVATLTDADPRPAGLVATPGVPQRFQWSAKPYLETGFFDPDSPLRYEVGGALEASYEVLPGLVAKGTLRKRLFGNADQKAPGKLTVEQYDGLTTEQIKAGNNGVYRVRSDGRMYAGNDDLQVPEMTLNWYAHPSATTYTRVTVGLLERMYGGVSAEVLWKPVQSPLALGLEIDRVKKRDYRDAFGFLDYETTSAHVSAYYEFGDGFVAQIDAGRYLAGDEGATVSLKREFANGWSIGAYATKTNLSAEEFGEGTFDKGITFSAPLSWAVGTPTKKTVGGNLGSLNRDGGQRVRVDGRLYDTIRDAHSVRMYDGWGRFWR